MFVAYLEFPSLSIRASCPKTKTRTTVVARPDDSTEEDRRSQDSLGIVKSNCPSRHLAKRNGPTVHNHQLVPPKK